MADFAIWTVLTCVEICDKIRLGLKSMKEEDIYEKIDLRSKKRKKNWYL